MELEHLHVLERDATPIGDRHAVAGQGVRVARDLEHLPEAARREQDGPRAEGVDLARGELDGDDPADRLRRPAGERQVDDLELVEERHLVLDALLVEGLEDGVPCAVSGEARPPHGCRALVASVPPETPLVDQPLRRSVERQPQVLQVDDGIDRVVAHHPRRVLVDEVVAALHGVEPVPLPVVLLRVAERGTHPALGGAGVGAGRVELADDADARLRPEVLLQLERRVEAGAARPDDEAVEVVDADAGRPRKAHRRGGEHRSGHENGPTGGAVSGLKKMTTSNPSRIQTTATAPSRITSRPRAVRFAT